MDGFASQFYSLYQMENARKNWQNIDGMEALGVNLGVREPGEKPSWGETRSSGTGGSQPCGGGGGVGVRPISSSH